MDEFKKKLGRLERFKYPLLVLLAGVLLMLLPLSPSTPKLRIRLPFSVNR